MYKSAFLFPKAIVCDYCWFTRGPQSPLTEAIILLYNCLRINNSSYRYKCIHTQFRREDARLANQFAVTPLANNITPVSYTHLDVYKRQGLRSDSRDSLTLGKYW